MLSFCELRQTPVSRGIRPSNYHLGGTVPCPRWEFGLLLRPRFMPAVPKVRYADGPVPNPIIVTVTVTLTLLTSINPNLLCPSK